MSWQPSHHRRTFPSNGKCAEGAAAGLPLWSEAHHAQRGAPMTHEQLPIVLTGVSSGIGARTAQILARTRSAADRHRPQRTRGVQRHLCPGGPFQPGRHRRRRGRRRSGRTARHRRPGQHRRRPGHRTVAYGAFRQRLRRPRPGPGAGPAPRRGYRRRESGLQRGRAVAHVKDRAPLSRSPRTRPPRWTQWQATRKSPASPTCSPSSASGSSPSTWPLNCCPQRIRVNSVSPGPVATPILEDFKKDHGRDKVEGARRPAGPLRRPGRHRPRHRLPAPPRIALGQRIGHPGRRWPRGLPRLRPSLWRCTA